MMQGVTTVMTEKPRASTALVDAYRRFRAADQALSTRVRAETSLGDSEIKVLTFLIDQREVGHDVTPGELARTIGVSSASMTALLDRLEKAGSVTRVNHPTDRRSIYIRATPTADSMISDTVAVFDRRLAALGEQLGPEASRTVTEFFESLADTADDVAFGQTTAR